MKLYYDIERYYPYLCISDASEEALKEVVNRLRSNDLEPIKFYTNPKHPASDGNYYTTLFRLPFADEKKLIKPPKDLLRKIFQESEKVSPPEPQEKESKEVSNGFNDLLTAEKRYLEEIREILNNQRNVLEKDKEYFKEQLSSLENLMTRTQEESNKMLKHFSTISKNLSVDISGLINKKNLNYEELNELNLKLSEKERVINESENSIQRLQEDLEKQKEYYKERIEEVERKSREELTEAKREYQKNIQIINAKNLDLPESTTKSTPDELIKELNLYVLGHSSLTRADIRKIFQNVFEEKLNVQLPKSNIHVAATNYEKIKSIPVLNHIKGNKYDYLIFGPRPHSSKGWDIKQSPVTIRKNLKLTGKFIVENDKPLSKSFFESKANDILSQWIEENKEYFD
ncbi:hypothetical protein [Robiginitalea aurantiaca]|uniref:Uncharacterized protein n=1 Tax=Robiginitalea aurantiaca TaxID=3056915 RepID=A0ABT7WBD8_9FLAO|nr:hypothetical protein [Robiginitalea aurantiaca]MDM9630231.1 hypothetical protein [Robiginitalea aurantiaca]